MSDDPSSSPTGRAASDGFPDALPDTDAITLALTATPDWGPPGNDLIRAAQAAARAAVSENGQIPADAVPPMELSLLLTTDDVVRRLNASYRGQDRPTNVLSFPMLRPEDFDSLAEGGGGDAPAAPVLLGDVILARGVVGEEAGAQGKALADHVSHLVVHGVLHLFGHDHDRDAAAAAMERREARILATLGIADPYGEPLDEVQP